MILASTRRLPLIIGHTAIPRREPAGQVIGLDTIYKKMYKSFTPIDMYEIFPVLR